MTVVHRPRLRRSTRIFLVGLIDKCAPLCHFFSLYVALPVRKIFLPALRSSLSAR